MAINSLSASSYGLSGLVSGMNTQEMVEKMLSGTKGKITAQQQKKAQLEYKQDLYRGLAAQLRALKSTYFDFSSGSATNLYSSAFFNSMTATTSSRYFTATATTTASTGTSRIDYIKQLAKSATLQGTTKASGRLKGKTMTDNTATGELKQLIDKFKNDNTGSLKFTVDGGGTPVEVELTSADLRQIAGKTNADAAQILNTLFEQKAQAAGRTTADVVARFANGKMTFSSQNGGSLSVSGDSKGFGLALLGLTGTTVSSTGKLDTALNPNKLLPSVQVSLDGATEKTIYFDPEKYLNTGATNYAESMQKSLQEALDTSFGHVINVGLNTGTDAATGAVTTEFTYDIVGNDPSRRFTIRGGEDAINILGIKSGSSNKMTTGMRLDEINFQEPLEGNTFKFTINDVDFNVTSDTTLSSLMSQINSSDANVRLSYNPDTDKFTLESKSAGEGGRIDISQEQGNLLTSLLGSTAVQGNSEVMGNQLAASNSVVAHNSTFTRTTGGTFSLNVVLADGRRKEMSFRVTPDKKLTNSDHFENQSQLLSAINSALNDNDVARAAGLEMTVNSSGEVELKAGAGVIVETVAGGSTSMLTALGFTNGQTNAANKNTLLSDLGVNPAGIQIGGAGLANPGVTTVGGLETELTALIQSQGGAFSGASVTFDETEGAFHVSGVQGNATLQINGAGSLFRNNGQLKFTAQSQGAVQDGQDAIFSYNGTEVRRSENTFTMDGVSYTLSGVFDGRAKDANGNFSLVDGTVVDQQGFVLTDDGTGTGTYVRNSALMAIITAGGADPSGATVAGAGLDGEGYVVDANGNQLLNSAGEAIRAVDSNGYLVGTTTKVMAVPEDQYVYNDVAGETTVTRDTEKIFDGIMKFVEDYNKIMEELHSLLVEKPEYKDYAPLTDEQKAAMSDREVELWEEKSKTGLLRSDKYLNDIWDNLRSVLYKKPSDSSIALYNLGITTSGSTEYGGQLIVDQSKLRSMLQTNAEDIGKLFAGNSVDSLGKAMADALDRAASSSVASPGILTQVAGSSARTDTSSSLYKQMKEIDDNLETLKDRYESEYNRYWKQFNAMEQMIQQMNQQSSWLSQQMSGS